ncbi:hypothetical protein NUW54_g10689 [Trametes sanguinea]|uniref:Uncharacterized protein n=1 Tax=Trametes sanguinea TaxID=158606 RepID=A0ACC1NUD2_9APHY|nr:hypothetical protein NUW54_g10689 [Trametes sanguinea]
MDVPHMWVKPQIDHHPRANSHSAGSRIARPLVRAKRVQSDSVASMRAIKPVCAAWTTVSHFLAMFDPASDSEGHDAYERQLAPNPSLSLLRHARADVLRRTLNEAVPYCCGTLRPTSSSLVLYYGKSEQARRIDLLRASTTALSDLEKYCDPATFGVSQKDVLDLAYRKAGKLDRDHFAFNFDLERSGVLDIVLKHLRYA